MRRIQVHFIWADGHLGGKSRLTRVCSFHILSWGGGRDIKPQTIEHGIDNKVNTTHIKYSVRHCCHDRHHLSPPTLELLTRVLSLREYLRPSISVPLVLLFRHGDDNGDHDWEGHEDDHDGDEDGEASALMNHTFPGDAIQGWGRNSATSWHPGIKPLWVTV